MTKILGNKGKRWYPDISQSEEFIRMDNPKGFSITGTLETQPEEGANVFVMGLADWFCTSMIQKISHKQDGSLLIKTINSTYKLEKI